MTDSEIIDSINYVGNILDGGDRATARAAQKAAEAPKKRVRLNKGIHEDVALRSARIFEEIHGSPLTEMISKDIGIAYGNRGIYQCNLAVADQLGLSHMQRYNLLQSIGTFTLVAQSEALGDGMYTHKDIIWDKKRRRFAINRNPATDVAAAS